MTIMNLPPKIYQMRRKQVKAQRMKIGVTQAYAIKKKGLFGAAVIKKRRYLPKHIDGDAINRKLSEGPGKNLIYYI